MLQSMTSPTARRAHARDDPNCDRRASNPHECPVGVMPKAVRLCRHSEVVLELLPPRRREFVEEDGERVVVHHRRRVASAEFRV